MMIINSKRMCTIFVTWSSESFYSRVHDLNKRKLSYYRKQLLSVIVALVHTTIFQSKEVLWGFNHLILPTVGHLYMFVSLFTGGWDLCNNISAPVRHPSPTHGHVQTCSLGTDDD